MKLKHFDLQPYNSSNKDHKLVIFKLINDKISMKYLGDLSYLLSDLNNIIEIDGFYIVSYLNEYIGIITLSEVVDKYFITYGLIKESRGKNLASLLLKEFSNQVFLDNNNINDLYLSINKQNIASRKVAYNAGYIKDSEVRFKKSK